MDSSHNRDYTRDQVVGILDIIQACVHKHQFHISLNENRQENIDFIQEYNLSDKRQIQLLLKIVPEDFCYSMHNTHPGYQYEILYVFVPVVELFNVEGGKEKVDVYTKFNIVQKGSNYYTIVISFHKRNKPVSYLFR